MKNVKKNKNIIFILTFVLFSNILLSQYQFTNTQKVKITGKGERITLSGNNNKLLSFFKVDTVEVSGYTLESINDSLISDIGIYIDGAKYIRISNCIIRGFNHSGIFIIHADTGCDAIVSNCMFIDNYKCKSGNGEGYGISLFGQNKNWITDYKRIKPVKITSCYFTGHRHGVAGGGNAAYECYNNVFVNNLWSSHAIDGHDSYGSGLNLYSTRLMIVHDNVITNTFYKNGQIIDGSLPANKLLNVGIFCRGGTIIAHNNTVQGCRFAIGLQTSIKTECVPKDCVISGTKFTPYPGSYSSSSFYNFSGNNIKEGVNYILK
jgi:hypothetical protein